MMRRVAFPGLIVAVIALASITALGSQAERPDCREWNDCRALALEAREAGDFERFHDLAWRAWQTRGGTEPELMFLLARAQSLSGRPLDALVMLRRMAELGEAYDALTHEDLSRARSLPGWREIEVLLGRTADAATPPPPAEAPPDEEAPTPEKIPAAGEPAAPSSAPAPVALPLSSDVARFSIPPYTPGGLAYDGVSRRFIIGNLPARKLTVVGEGTNRPATYAGAAAAFYDVRALQIDRRQGDLWVLSADCDSTGTCRSALHKLQLISGRVLKVFDPPRETSRLLDVAVSARGPILLDGEGPRLLVADSDNGSMKPLLDLPAGTPTSLAPAPDGQVVYVAYGDRLVRAELRGRRIAEVGEKDPRLEGITRIRWHRGGLIAARGSASSSGEIVRLRLSRGGTRLAAIQPLSDLPDRAGALLGMDVAGDELYYLVSPASDGSEAVVRSVSLR
jgi:hypothetical protein